MQTGPDRTALLDLFRPLNDRSSARAGLVIGEGGYLVERMIARGLELTAVVCEERLESRYAALAAGRCPVLAMTRPELAALAGFPFHRGVLAAARRQGLPGLAEYLAGAPGARTLVVCPEFTDTDNLGAVIRSAAGLGADAVVLGRRCCDPFYRRCVRVSMGAVFDIPLVRLDDDMAGAGLLKERGFRLAAAVLDQDAVTVQAYRRPERLALLIGAEGPGLPAAWLERADERLTIPMARGVDSLNVGVAAGIMLERLGAGGESARGI